MRKYSILSLDLMSKIKIIKTFLKKSDSIWVYTEIWLVKVITYTYCMVADGVSMDDL